MEISIPYCAFCVILSCIYNNDRTRASSDPCLLCVPPISKTCANSFFDRSFVYAAPTLWNTLDLDISLLPFDAFKKRVKTHLYLKYFAN